MHRINTPDQVAATGRVKVDAGEGVELEVPVIPIVPKGTWDDPADLRTAHLDTITTPGFYTQIFASRAIKTQGYPHESAAGVLEVKVWNKSAGNVIQIYTPWQSAAMVKRTRYNGSWQTWYGVNGQALA